MFMAIFYSNVFYWKINFSQTLIHIYLFYNKKSASKSNEIKNELKFIDYALQ